MPITTQQLFNLDPSTFTIGEELANRLGELLDSVRADLRPRNFPERHLVDELALSRWRGLRVTLMEKAIYEHESVDFQPRELTDEDGVLFEPHEDVYHLAMSHAPERHATVLAALGRLEARYARAFSNALRLLIALRRGSPPPLADSDAPVTRTTTPAKSRRNTRKEAPPCEPSPNTLPTM